MFSEAFAESCNITFAKAALRLPAGKLEEYAQKMGLEEKVGWHEESFFKMGSFHQFSGEDSGQVFSAKTPNDDEGVIIQTAIGQRDVQLTPLQAANSMATIIDGGKKKEVTIVKEIQYKTGTVFHSFEEHTLPGDQIEPYTAYQIKKMMEAVVDHGTAKSIRDAKWKTAGKTGTAQIRVNGEMRNNQWFVGYAPADNPQYVFSIVAEQEHPTSPNRVLPVMKKIIDELAAEEEQKTSGLE